MAKYIVDGSSLTAVADAIREKTGKTGTLTLDQMAEEIAGIEGGSSGGSGGDGDVGWVEIGYPSGIDKNLKITDLTNWNLRCPNAKIIDESAFLGTRGLICIDLPMAEEIGESAFNGCLDLVSVSAPNVTTIQANTFQDCERLATVDFQSVTTIMAAAFLDCYALSVIDLPKATSIGDEAFYRCASLSAVILRTTDAVCVCEFSAFANTPIMQGQGHIYVPAVMYESYRSAYEAALDQLMPGFFSVLFRKIEDYPEVLEGWE